jgi:hypothetical protein
MRAARRSKQIADLEIMGPAHAPIHASNWLAPTAKDA